MLKDISKEIPLGIIIVLIIWMIPVLLVMSVILAEMFLFLGKIAAFSIAAGLILIHICPIGLLFSKKQLEEVSHSWKNLWWILNIGIMVAFFLGIRLFVGPALTRINTYSVMFLAIMALASNISVMLVSLHSKLKK